jgi:hypothetical protein
MMEYDLNEGTENPYLVINSYGTSEYRKYPNQENENCITVAEKTTNDTVEALRHIVPGDIWVKRSSADGSYSSHIAIVAYVPPNADMLSRAELLDQIILIEGEISNKIQSVIKKLSMGMYDTKKIPNGIKFYDDNFTTPGGNEIIDLNCNSWAIRRLK